MALLPLAVSSYYWECRLSDGARQVDFLTQIAGVDEGRMCVTEKGADAGSSEVFPENLLWNQAHDFFRQWSDPRSALHEAVPLIWLEFDHIEDILPEVPLPSFSFCLDPLYSERRSWEQYVTLLNMRKRCAVAEKGLQLLFGHALSPRQEQSLVACFEALPAGGRIIHISAMVARSPAVVKLYGSVPKDQLFAYLARIGWPGSAAELTDIVTMFCTPDIADADMFIDVTVEEAVTARLGLAFAQQQIDNLPCRDATRRILLERCVQTGLCTREKREALLTWPGGFRALFQDREQPARIQKWLDVKIVYQPGHPLEAKAYLGFMSQLSLF
jgi:hypothetical protein